MKEEDENLLKQIPKETPLFILGAGSNLLVRDGGFNGIVIKLGKSLNSLTLQENCIEVGSSVLDINFIGFIIPGLIASWMDRQGIIRTTSVILIVSSIVHLFLILILKIS